ncbi:MAG: hypothetical protein PUC20_03515 [Firmicutes bacterium]|nr:hypothetical protein [Bacillota bacterium]
MTITLAMVLKACAVIGAVGAAVVYIIKLLQAIVKPISDMQATLEKHAEYLEKDKERLDKLEKEIDGNKDATNLILKSIMTMLAHMETGNSTKQMAKMRKDIEEYLIDR